MTNYNVKITFYDSGIPRTVSFYKECSSLKDLKQAFLKRFGNVNNAPNSTMKDKNKVKEITYKAKDINEWTSTINQETRWYLIVSDIG